MNFNETKITIARNTAKISALISCNNSNHKPLEKQALVIMIPGFTGYKDETNFLILAQELLKNGIASIVFDPLGFGQSSGDLQTDFRMSNTLKDIDTIYDWSIKQGFAEEKIFLLGVSLGAEMAVIKAAQNPGRYKAVVAISPPSQFGRGDVMERYLDSWEKTGYYTKRSSKYGELIIPYDYYLDARIWDALKFAPQVVDPVLIVVGGKDQIVPAQISLGIFEKLAAKDKKYSEIPDMGHFFKHEPQNMQVLHQLVIEFIEGHL